MWRRAAVEECPEDEDGAVSEGEEEQRKIREAQEIKTQQLIAALKEKDRQLALLLEDKMTTFCELVELLANNEDSTSTWALLGSDTQPPKYSHLLEHGFHSPAAKETLSHVTAPSLSHSHSRYYFFFFRRLDPPLMPPSHQRRPGRLFQSIISIVQDEFKYSWRRD